MSEKEKKRLEEVADQRVRCEIWTRVMGLF
jgi:hypothetical protein